MTACVSAALPDLHAQMQSWMGTILSLTLFATYCPVDVRESAPRITPPSKQTAIIVVWTIHEFVNKRDDKLECEGQSKRFWTQRTPNLHKSRPKKTRTYPWGDLSFSKTIRIKVGHFNLCRGHFTFSLKKHDGRQHHRLIIDSHTPGRDEIDIQVSIVPELNSDFFSLFLCKFLLFVVCL